MTSLTETAVERPQLKVMISHGKDDAWVAGQIARRLNELEIQTFLDADDILSGDDFKQSVWTALHDSNEVLVLLTRSAARRVWIWAEIGAAWIQKKRIVVVLYGLSRTDLERFPGGYAMLTDFQMLDINRLEQYFAELIDRREQMSRQGQ